MDKMKMESVDLTAQNIEKIGAIFPTCITEMVDEKGKLKKAINFELLKQMLSGDVLDGDEAYEFTWVGKKAAIVEANKPIRKTLRPCPEESKEWDTTENLFIEGDNLEVLKLLQESYLGAVKLIYIDPPYNTGNDFIYNDDFKISKDEYSEVLSVEDEDGNRLFRNTDSNGRFHSDWCSMIYSRLMLARNLLSDDGAIFISIDDNEVCNMKKICDEIFGEANFFSCVSWHRNYASANDAKTFSNVIDYVLIYRKSDAFERNLLPRTEKQNGLYKYDSNDGKGRWRSDNLSVRTYSANYDYPIQNPNTGLTYNPPSGRSWITNKETMQRWIEENRVFFGQKGDGAPQLKRYLSEVQDGVVPTTYWSYEDCGHNDEARKEIKGIFEGKPPFDSPKPTRLLKQIIRIATNKNDLILDFFAGSATTADAIIQYNAEDGGRRRFIMIQLPEKCDENSEAFKAGYNTICDIGKERIRRAGGKVKSETGAKIDYGFRVLKLDESNMTDIYYSAVEYNQSMLASMESNVKKDRTGVDLLFSCLLEWGLPLSMPYKSEQIEGFTVHIYDPESGDKPSLIACFDENISDNVIKIIAKRQPLRAVFRDSSFANSPAKINVTEIFKLLAPDTRVKVI